MLLPSRSSLEASPKTKTITTPLADDDAIKTSIATSTSVATYTGGAINGALAANQAPLAWTLTVTTSTHASTYNTVDPIVITGLDVEGNTITESLTLTAANGNETVSGTKAFSKVTQIVVPAQTDALGTFKFGVKDLVLVGCRQIRCTAGAILKVGFEDGTTDTWPAALDGERFDVDVKKIFSTGTTLAGGFTILF
jgi:hypothetical protein